MKALVNKLTQPLLSLFTLFPDPFQDPSHIRFSVSISYLFNLIYQINSPFLHVPIPDADTSITHILFHKVETYILSCYANSTSDVTPPFTF